MSAREWLDRFPMRPCPVSANRRPLRATPARLKLLDSKVVLAAFTLLAFVSVGLALFGPAQTALVAFPMSGFFLSVMYSIVFSLGLNSVSRYHGALSGILCTGILGGAVVPLLVGLLGDRFGLRVGLLSVFATLGYILSVCCWARPLVRNETILTDRKRANWESP
jgi:FHS family L-fucose permease-like MFS transporter